MASDPVHLDGELFTVAVNYACNFTRSLCSFERCFEESEIVASSCGTYVRGWSTACFLVAYFVFQSMCDVVYPLSCETDCLLEGLFSSFPIPAFGIRDTEQTIPWTWLPWLE